jgi:soluble lytic murein transglycosylase-like protein
MLPLPSGLLRHKTCIIKSIKENRSFLLSINRIDHSAYLVPLRYPDMPGVTEKRTFSDIMNSLAAGNPTPLEIKTMSSYLQLRLNEALLRAMGGGHYVSPMALFMKPSFSKPEAAAPPVSQESQPAAASLDQIVQQAATAHHVDPSLISAVIKAESGGNPRATSPKGAMGMMQLMPGTARDLGVKDPYDPLQNVMGGTKYLKMLLSRYDGNRDLALAAYNWGPGNLEKSHRSMPRETVEYVARIKRFLGERA